MLKLSRNTSPRKSSGRYAYGRGVKKKSGIGRVIRNTILTCVVLLLVFVGGGLLYTWYMGKHSPASVSVKAPKPTAQKTTPISPHQPKPDAVIGASVQYITSPVTPGMNASITVKTNAGAKCTIVVEYDKVASKDSGLVPKIAEEFGMVTWAWTVEASAPLGKWPVKVTCANVKNSAVVKGDLEVVKTIPAN